MDAKSERKRLLERVKDCEEVLDRLVRRRAEEIDALEDHKDITINGVKVEWIPPWASPWRAQ